MNTPKNTKTREAFSQIIKAYPYPLSLEELHGFISKQLPGVAFSTIYRLAKQLEAEGLIQRIDWRERGSRYEWTGRTHHHHIVCTVCGATADFDDSVVQLDREAVARQTGFVFSQHHVELEGICPACQKGDAVVSQ